MAKRKKNLFIKKNTLNLFHKTWMFDNSCSIMAKKFSFRLDPVLKLRSHKVNQEKEALGFVVGRRTMKEIQINRQEEYKSGLLRKKQHSTKAIDLQARSYHIHFVNEEIKKLEHEKEELIEIEGLRRQKLSAAMRDEKVLVRLREKKQIAHQEETGREETIHLDEIARNRHIKNENF